MDAETTQSYLSPKSASVKRAKVFQIFSYSQEGRKPLSSPATGASPRLNLRPESCVVKAGRPPELGLGHVPGCEDLFVLQLLHTRCCSDRHGDDNVVNIKGALPSPPPWLLERKDNNNLREGCRFRRVKPLTQKGRGLTGHGLVRPTDPKANSNLCGNRICLPPAGSPPSPWAQGDQSPWFGRHEQGRGCGGPAGTAAR